MFVLEEYEHARAQRPKIGRRYPDNGSTCEASRVRLAGVWRGTPARAIVLQERSWDWRENVRLRDLHGTSTN